MEIVNGPSGSGRNLKRVISVAFLLVLLAEWGSHTVFQATTSAGDGSAISAYDDQHGDLCDSRLPSDNGRNERQSPDTGHEVFQSNGLLNDSSRIILWRDVSQIEFSSAKGLFRPPSSPFHPPELS